MLNDTVSKLHEHQKMTQDLPSRDEFYRLSTTPADEVQRLRGELDSTRKRLAVCQEASDRASTDRIHMVEDITMGHDGQQLFVSTLGDLFNVKRAIAGGRAIQFVGSISDESLKYLLEAQKQPRQ
ncbi:Di-copper centre-containing protein [Apiospora arundinis]